MREYSKKIIQNFAIFLLILVGIRNLVTALPFELAKPYMHLYQKIIDPNFMIINHVFAFSLGCVMLLLAHRLYKRIRVAWAIEVVSLIATLAFHFAKGERISPHLFITEIFILIVLLLSHKDFCRESDHLTFRKALMFVCASLLLVIANASVGILIMKTPIRSITDIYNAVINSIQLLVLMDTDVVNTTTRLERFYADSLICINWICIISCLLLSLKPLVYEPIATKHDNERARQLVLKFGQNPISYLAVENDKKYFFGQTVNGVCAYRIVGSVFVVCGDMICDRDDGFVFLNEILAFCKQNGYEVLFLNVTDYFLGLYKLAGFGVIKYGEDACFALHEYSLIGGKPAKVRAAINHAANTGVTVHEYRPMAQRNTEIERQINQITHDWLGNKGGEEFGFMLGGTALSSPYDRRYFYACDADGVMLGFVVFLPYLSGEGYLADVTRRANDAPQGVIEKIIYDAFMIMKEEGVIWGNMGLSPLYNVAASDRAILSEKIFSFIYENINSSYDFKALHHSKKKYAPTHWQCRYLAYSPKPFTPNYGIAIVRAQMTGRVTKHIVRSIFVKKGASSSGK